MTTAVLQGAAQLAAPASPSLPSTGPADREAAEAAVGALYRAAGLPAPAVAWMPSPIALARAWKLQRQRVGEGVRAAVFDRPAHRLLGQLRRVERGELGLSRGALADLTALIAHEGQKAGVGTSARVRMLFTLLRRITHRRTWQSFRALSVSPYDYAWLLGRDARTQLGGDDRTPFDALATLIANAGWIVPCQKLCWISDRPVTLALDDRGRLHGKDGPALAYADGWRRYAWKGIEVPSAYIQHPERITLNAIDSQTDIFVRRCLIEMVTPKRFIYMGGADLVMRDDAGTLWRRTWPRGDAWAAVEVVNGTPGPDGQLDRYVLQVPPELETARAAVAWTYGMTDQQYRNLVLRT